METKPKETEKEKRERIAKALEKRDKAVKNNIIVRK